LPGIFTDVGAFFKDLIDMGCIVDSEITDEGLVVNAYTRGTTKPKRAPRSCGRCTILLLLLLSVALMALAYTSVKLISLTNSSSLPFNITF